MDPEKREELSRYWVGRWYLRLPHGEEEWEERTRPRKLRWLVYGISGCAAAGTAALIAAIIPIPIVRYIIALLAGVYSLGVWITLVWLFVLPFDKKGRRGESS